MSLQSPPVKSKLPKSKKQSAVGIGLVRLKNAFSQVRTDSGDDFLPDLIGYKEFGAYLNQKLSGLLKVVPEYHPRSVSDLEVPKSPYFSRPGVALRIEDRVVYQAAVNSIASLLDQRLEPRDVVFGFRVAKPRQGNRILEHNVNRWLEMRQTLRIRRTGFAYLVRTDMVGYYEHISHKTLINDLEAVGVKKPVRDLLTRLLLQWETSAGHGLPQNLEPSSVLGNFYLDPIDKAMRRAGFEFARFMDDLYITGKTELEVRNALKLLTAECRKRRLFLNTKKTEILQGSQIDSFLSDGNDDLQAIDYFLDVGAEDDAKELLHDLTKKAVARYELNEREYKFLLGRLKRVGDPILVRRCLKLFKKYPQLSDHISRYLRMFAARRPTIEREVFAFLASNDNIYPWQEMWLLRCLFGCKKIHRENLDWLRARAQENHPWFNQSLYLLLLGLFGDESDRDYCWSFMGKHPEVDRAVVLSCQLSPKTKRTQRCNSAASANAAVFDTAKLVKEQADAVWPT